MTNAAGAAYGADYYQHYSPRTYERNEYWLTIFRALADQIARQIAPKTALDAGCAMGILVETLRERGVDAFGVDLSEYAIEHAGAARPYCRVGSITADFDARYDLIVCIEVLEHLPPDEASNAIANFCRHTDDVLFSSTPMHFRDTSHLNVQPPEYWAERFAGHGFYRDVDFDAVFVSPWAVRFRRGRDPWPRVVSDYERVFARLSYERNELRAMAAELQEKENAAQARVEPLERAAALAQEEAVRSRGELDAARARLASVEHDLTQARATIANMERSAFWRLRDISVAIRRLFGGRG